MTNIAIMGTGMVGAPDRYFKTVGADVALYDPPKVLMMCPCSRTPMSSFVAVDAVLFGRLRFR
jgi:hypothetical protein